MNSTLNKSSKKIKVAFIVGEFPDEIGSFVMNQIDGLLSLGVDVTVFAVRKSNKKTALEFFKNCSYKEKIHFLKVPRNFFVRFVKAVPIIVKVLTSPRAILPALNFKKYKKVAASLIPLYFNNYFMKYRGEFDILHCHFGQRGLYGAALKDAGVKGKLITSFYGGDLSYFIENTSKKIYEPLIKRGDLFLPLSENFKRLLIKMRANPKKTIVHHVGTDLEIFKISQKKHKIPVLLMIARYVEKKGHQYLLEALEQIVKKERVKAILVGDGPLRSKIENMAKNKHLNKVIEFKGTVPREYLPKLYGEADIYVLPSHTANDGDKEGTPVSLIEAQASGLPTVSTFHSGIPEVVIDKQTGFLVPEKDSKALAERILYLIKNPKIREKMGKKGRRFVMYHYDKNQLSKKLLELYKTALMQKIQKPI